MTKHLTIDASEEEIQAAFRGETIVTEELAAYLVQLAIKMGNLKRENNRLKQQNPLALFSAAQLTATWEAVKFCIDFTQERNTGTLMSRTLPPLYILEEAMTILETISREQIKERQRAEERTHPL